jgi:hypothetical protein
MFGISVARSKDSYQKLRALDPSLLDLIPMLFTGFVFIWELVHRQNRVESVPDFARFFGIQP